MSEAEVSEQTQRTGTPIDGHVEGLSLGLEGLESTSSETFSSPGLPRANNDRASSEKEMLSFTLLEATIEDHRKALASGLVTSVELVVRYLVRIAAFDLRGPSLNAFTNLNPRLLEEAKESDDRRASGLPVRPLEGIPYTLKDSFKYNGIKVTSGSPAFENLMSSEDSFVATKLRAAGAILLGQTNMPPMAAGGMQRGLYGRAESPYNADYLTAAFSSGSSNGAASSTAASFAAFALGSETVSSGRSPASNNGLVAYTPSRGVISCRGLWPLYGTCDVPVPYTRTVEDMYEVLSVLVDQDPTKTGDFWRAQPYVTLPTIPVPHRNENNAKDSLRGKRIGVPKVYVGESDPEAKPVPTSPEILNLWARAKADLEALGAEVVLTDFPLVTNYEDDSISQQPNNVVGAPSDWNQLERGAIIAKAWDDFLIENKDPNLSSLAQVDGHKIFPKPQGYVPDTFQEIKNVISYASLPDLAKLHGTSSIYDIPGMSEALPALEAQRKRDLEDWMDAQGLDLVVFPANGDVGKADLEENLESARHALQNGTKYSNGGRAIRHLGVPTVSVTMGKMPDTKMPCNLTFAGKAYDDEKLLSYAYAYEQKSKNRTAPPRTPALASDTITRAKSSIPHANTSSQKASEAMISITTSSKTLDESGRWLVKLGGRIRLKCRDTLPSFEVYLAGKLVFQLFADGLDATRHKANLDMNEGSWGIESECEQHESPPFPYLSGKALGEQIMAVAVVKSGNVVDAKMVLI